MTTVPDVSKKAGKRAVSLSEKLVYGASVLLVTGVLGAALWLDAAPREAHPRLTVGADGEAWQDGEARAVPWVARNPGTWDVEQVQVEVRCGASAGSVQEVDYLPRGATRRGVSRCAPGESGVPTIRIASYRLP